MLTGIMKEEVPVVWRATDLAAIRKAFAHYGS